jgi:hypothetical protein
MAEGRYQALIQSEELRFSYFDVKIGESGETQRIVFELAYA